MKNKMKFLRKYNESFSKEYYDDIFLDLTDDNFRVSVDSSGFITIRKNDKSYFKLNKVIDYILSASDYSFLEGYFLYNIDLQTNYGWYALYTNDLIRAKKRDVESRLWNSDVTVINLNFRMNSKSK